MKNTDIRESIVRAFNAGRSGQAKDYMLLLGALRVVPADLDARLATRYESWSTILAYAIHQHDPKLFMTAWAARFEDILDIESAFLNMDVKHLEAIEKRPQSAEHRKALEDALAKTRELTEGRVRSIEDINEALKTHDPLDVLDSFLTGAPLKPATPKDVKLSPEELQILHLMCDGGSPEKRAACKNPDKKVDAPTAEVTP